MSYPTDVLMYVSVADRKAMETFNERLSQITRFNAHPWMVDTNDWSGPNVFGGDVWAFGADYLLAEDVQKVLDDVKWCRPQNVVALVTWVDGDGACETVVCRRSMSGTKPNRENSAACGRERRMGSPTWSAAPRTPHLRASSSP